MDKETLSHYGWIIILVLILSVMLALATPFGSFIAEGFKATYTGLFDTNQKALGTTIIGIVGGEDEEGEGDDITSSTLIPGLYQTGAIKSYKNGEDVTALLITPWDELIDDGIVVMNEGEMTTPDKTSLAGDLVFDNSVTSIKAKSFYGHQGITGAYFCEETQLETVGDQLFMDCRTLLIADFSSTKLTSMYQTLTWCYNLEEVYLPETLKSISYNGLAACYALEYVDIPDSVTSLGWNAFYGCTKLKEIKIPDGVTSIGTSAFEDCYKLTSIEIPSSVKRIEKRAFRECRVLESVTFAPDSNLYFIGEFAFYNTNFTSIVIPKSVTQIDHQALCSVDNLTSVTFEEGGTKPLILTCCTFQGDSNLQEVHLPKRLFAMGTSSTNANIFSGCSAVKRITYGGTKQDWENIVIKDSSWKPSNLEELVCTDGTAHLSHTGGTATCSQKAVCSDCGIEYGKYKTHNISNGVCRTCSAPVTVIQTQHDPHLNNQDNVVVGTWDYSDAQSVIITITYQTEGADWDWASLKSGDEYIDFNGNLSSYETRFGGTTKMTITFKTTTTTGSVIFNSNSSANSYYGVYVAVSPNY